MYVVKRFMRMYFISFSFPVNLLFQHRDIVTYLFYLKIIKISEKCKINKEAS